MRILITGASSGIGEAMARQSGARHHDVVVVARRKDLLESLAIELKNDFDIEAEVIVADLTDPKQCALVVNRINAGGIDVLINNAGFGSAGPFVELDIDNELNEIDLNVKALVSLAHAAAIDMSAKKRGTIVNVSSVASYQPMTGNAIYGATKAFVTSFSHALREELSDTGVNVMVLCPGLTDTDFFDRSRWTEASKTDNYFPSLWQSSEEVAKAAFRGIDRQKALLSLVYSINLPSEFPQVCPEQ